MDKGHKFISSYSCHIVYKDCTHKNICHNNIIKIFLRDNTKLIVSGVVAKGNADFPPEAVRVAHDKPMPQHDKRPAGQGGKGANISIQQPRKQ
jgi:hypothetical protein